MRRNYEEKLLQEIMRRNYHRKLSASIYHHAKNVGIIGILAYPKKTQKNEISNNRLFYDKKVIFLTNKDENSIRYAKENGRGKRERRKERERKVKGEIWRGRER